AWCLEILRPNPAEYSSSLTAVLMPDGRNETELCKVWSTTSACRSSADLARLREHEPVPVHFPSPAGRADVLATRGIRSATPSGRDTACARGSRPDSRSRVRRGRRRPHFLADEPGRSLC